MKLAVAVAALALAVAATQAHAARAIADATKRPNPVRLVLGELPARLRAVKPGVSTPAAVQAALGRASSRRGASEFRELAGLRFDTTVTYRHGRVDSVWHATGRSALKFRDIEPLLTEGQREELDRERREAGPGDENGRFLTVRWREAGVTARFLATESAPLANVSLEPARR